MSTARNWGREGEGGGNKIKEKIRSCLILYYTMGFEKRRTLFQSVESTTFKELRFENYLKIIINTFQLKKVP